MVYGTGSLFSHPRRDVGNLDAEASNDGFLGAAPRTQAQELPQLRFNSSR